MLVKKQHGEPPNPAALRPSGRVGRGALHFALNAQGRVGRGWGVSPADLTTDPLPGKEPEPSVLDLEPEGVLSRMTMRHYGPVELSFWFAC